MAVEQPRFWTRSGHPVLDLALTGGDDDPRAHWERLHVAADLRDWIDVAVPGAGQVPADDADLALARRLRDAVWDLALAASDHGTLPAGAVVTLNDVASGLGLRPELVGLGSLKWRSPTARQVLAHLAAEAVELFGGDRAGRVRRCAGEGCSLLFLDTSPPGRRRWCSMERCGNRAKVRAHRHRPGR